MSARARRSTGAESPPIPEPDPARLEAATRLADRAELPAQFGHVTFGTAGWTDKTLLPAGLFYPRGIKTAQQRLEFYAQHFRLVEVDATYYTLIAPDVTRRWAEVTPPSFRFDVKAHPILTGHPLDLVRLPSDLREAFAERGLEGRVYPDKIPEALAEDIERRFADSIEPLVDAQKLGCVMLQFPPWFVATRGNARRLEELAERWAKVPLAVEFRHPSWLEPTRRERVFELLRSRRLSYVCVDEPDVKGGGVPPLVRVTNPELAVLRLHGKNVAGWSKQGASVHERFAHLYSVEELEEWAPAVQQLARESKAVHAVFNNCVRNYAVLGAKGLSVLTLEVTASATRNTG